jgi:hypothetical protein
MREFTTRAGEIQTHNGVIAQREWSTEQWTKQGAMYAYSQAAVRFAEGCPAGRSPSPKDDIDYHGARFTCLLVEGETNVNTIVARASTRGWRVRRGAASKCGRPEGGRFACTEHSDVVATLSPGRPADEVNLCDRN